MVYLAVYFKYDFVSDVPVTQSNPTAGVSATAGEGDVAMETNQSSPLTDGSGSKL